MEFNEREECINNLIGGLVCCNFGDKIYLIHEPSSLDKMLSNQIYTDRLKEAELRGVLSNEQLVHKLRALNLWTSNDQSEIDILPQRIENTKVQLYEAYFRYKGRDPIRKKLKQIKTKYIDLIVKRDRLKRESTEGLATTSKNKFLICSNVTDEYNNKLWDSKDYWKQDAKLIDGLVREYMEAMTEGEPMRELSRTEPWRTLWAIAKTESALFGFPAIKLTAQQKTLIMWSRIYDSVYESMECPPDEVIEEDDMLDGWLIVQSRKRDDERKKAHGFGGEKDGVAGQEVFLFADSDEDAGRIQNMNTSTAKKAHAQRMELLSKTGKIDDAKLPESQMSMRMQAMQQMKSHIQRK